MNALFGDGIIKIIFGLELVPLWWERPRVEDEVSSDAMEGELQGSQALIPRQNVENSNVFERMSQRLILEEESCHVSCISGSLKIHICTLRKTLELLQ